MSATAAMRWLAWTLALTALVLVSGPAMLNADSGTPTSAPPPIETTLTGDHTNFPNWPTFIAFASRYVKSAYIPPATAGSTVTEPHKS